MSTTLDLHLRVVGTVLEEHALWHGSRLQAVKELVLQVLQERGPEPSTLRQISEILCYGGVPLVSNQVLRQAVHSLLRDDSKIAIVSNQPTTYRLLIDVPRRTDSLVTLVASAWQRHFLTCDSATLEQFQGCLALLFARYGCAAYNTLTSRGSPHVRLSDVLASTIPNETRELFAQCFAEFVLSTAPDDARLKVRLASTYALLRMNGAGNSDGAELHAFFANKTFLLDTNVLFEVLSDGAAQMEKIFGRLTALGAKFAVGAETHKEFESALRSKADQAHRIMDRGVDLGRLLQVHVMRAGWIAALLDEFGAPSREQMLERVERLLSQVQSVLSAAGVPTVIMERGGPPEPRARRIEEIKRLAREVRPFEKSDDVALHDALLWEAIEEVQLADVVLTRDRSLARLRVNGHRMSVMLDEVVACALVGGAREEEVAAFFNHALSRDLYPDSEFLSISDIETISGMESTLLAVPPLALKRAAVRLSQLRTARASSGEAVRDDEVGRIVLSAVSGYRDDRAVAERARAEAELAKEQAQAESAEKQAAQQEAERLRIQSAIDNETWRLRDEAAARESAKREGDLARERSELARERSESATLRAEADERARREVVGDARAAELRESARRKRDWMLWSAGMAIVSILLFAFKVVVAAGIAAASVVVALFWVALAQDTPRVSLAVFGILFTVVVGAAGLIEKWPQLRAVMHLAQ